MPLTIYRRGRIWHYRGTVAGRRLRGSCQTTDRAQATRTASQIDSSEWKRRDDGPEAVLTFAQAAMLYRSAGKSPRFLDKIEDYWKNTRVKDIRPSAIRQMAMDIYPGTSAATMNRQAITPCQAIINHAAEAELCPLIRVRKFKVDKKIKPPFTLEWVDAFCAHSDSPCLQALVLFMFATGARISEALAVQWDNVDLNGHPPTALIPRTKIGEQRLVNLPPRLLTAIAILPRVQGRPVFWYRTGWDLRRKWETTIRRAGIQRMTPHSGRHGFAITMLRSGEDVKTVAHLGGWKSAVHVLTSYAHAIEDITRNGAVFDTIDTKTVSHETRKPRKTGTS